MNLESHYALRGKVTDSLVRDLLGPEATDAVEPDEQVLREDPVTRYPVGVLFPVTGDALAPENDLDGEVGDVTEEDTAEDEPVAMASVRYPSSMGVTFAVDGGIDHITIDVSAVRFEPVEDGARSDQSEDRDRWNRVPHVLDTYVLDLREASFDRDELTPGLELFWRIRPPSDKGIRSVTVGLMNTNSMPHGEWARDAYAWFAPTLSVRTTERSDGFVARPAEQIIGVDDDDLASYRLLYRHALEFATGHGCAADWDLSDDPNRSVRVWATFTPRYELRLSDSNPGIVSQWFSLRALATAERSDVVAGLHRFVEEYREWVSARRSESEELVGEWRETAQTHLKRCEESADRMTAGIDRLGNDRDAWDAFRLTNQAMLEQRARSDWFRSTDKGAGPVVDGSHSWRPFQLAFILQSLDGIADGSHRDRELVDLLWFPTGGGKTEAYLGLIAFAVMLRRLQGRGGGITVLMRYTLRLLTIQQFERAATLICALELMRRRDPDRLGSVEIAIGLWVGGAATPLRLTEAKKALVKLYAHIPVDEGNPVQLHRCPWSGDPLDVTNYWVAKNNPRLVIACKNDACEFGDGLPAWIVDEDVYRRRPSLLIGTADKFASLPWRDLAANIFNLNSADPPPELIIQDELHLISGPLGTLSGLYETAVDELCTRDGVRPKVIASTATIRRAHDQVRGLFAREVRQFPAPGIDARDNWFSIEATPGDKGTRLYVGVMAPGTSQTSLMVRTYAALLQYAPTSESDESVVDAYWTLVGYFNSLRVLGGARMQVNDDVPDRIGVLAKRAGSEPRSVERVIELTSRETSSEIPTHLRDMDRSYPDPHRLDVVLATNMISVGIDIDRLSLMTVMGQPQSAAEYIQATSRVGCRWPGLVVVLLNAARSRDRSHYESFRAFHSALYRQVESSSVTPFSPRAVDRALHAVLIGLARLLVPHFSGNDGAAAIVDHREALEQVFDVVRRRVDAVDPGQLQAVEHVMGRIADEWRAVAEDGPLKYADPQNPTAALLVDATDTETDPEGHFRTLWSLRDVDTESELFLVKD